MKHLPLATRLLMATVLLGGCASAQSRKDKFAEFEKLAQTIRLDEPSCRAQEKALQKLTPVRSQKAALQVLQLVRALPRQSPAARQAVALVANESAATFDDPRFMDLYYLNLRSCGEMARFGALTSIIEGAKKLKLRPTVRAEIRYQVLDQIRHEGSAPGPLLASLSDTALLTAMTQEGWIDRKFEPELRSITEELKQGKKEYGERMQKSIDQYSVRSSVEAAQFELGVTAKARKRLEAVALAAIASLPVLP